jgi:prepilin-type processing-associated H-X9-DG protein
MTEIERLDAGKAKIRVVGTLVIVGAIFWIALTLLRMMLPGGRLRPLDSGPICGTNLKGIGAAMAVYADTYDDRYPTGSKWCDLLLQGDFVTEKQFLCPNSQAKIGQSSYAFNKNIAGMKRSQIPNDVVLVFEAAPGWNSMGGPENLTAEHHKGDGANILFADSSVKWIKRKDFAKLRWKVQENEE